MTISFAPAELEVLYKYFYGLKLTQKEKKKLEKIKKKIKTDFEEYLRYNLQKNDLR